MNNLEETIEIFREIASEADLSDIPACYISHLSYFDHTGYETVIDGADVSRLINRQYPYEHVERKEISIMLDIRKLAIDVMLELTAVFNLLDKR